MASRSISIDLDACSELFVEIPSTSSESFFSVSDVSEPSEPRFVFVNEFVLTADFDRVTTITTSARGDCNKETFMQMLHARIRKIFTFKTLSDSRCVRPLMLSPLMDNSRSPRFKRPSLSVGELFKIL